MIENQDRILIGYSGGKDSYTLIRSLSELQQKAPTNFQFEALLIDPMYEEINHDQLGSSINNYTKLNVLQINFERIITNNNHPKGNFCSFCARIRRGHLYSYAKKHGFNKVALGHHLEDTLETFLLNIFFSGQLKAMPPIYQTDDNQLKVIRPLVEVPESLIKEFILKDNFPILENKCPFNKSADAKRDEMKTLLNQLSEKYPYLKSHFLNSLKNKKHSHLF